MVRILTAVLLRDDRNGDDYDPELRREVIVMITTLNGGPMTVATRPA
jgi:hypothetical protein